MSATATSHVEDLSIVASLACDAADKFVSLYYERFDKQRHLAAKLYMDGATLAWDGNVVEGQANIQKFHENLPASDHTVESYDAQPVSSLADGDQTTFMLLISGAVRYHNNKFKPFSQTFILSPFGGTHKIVSDCYRIMD